MRWNSLRSQLVQPEGHDTLRSRHATLAPAVRDPDEASFGSATTVVYAPEARFAPRQISPASVAPLEGESFDLIYLDRRDRCDTSACL
jgi:hypothetical protein